MTTAKYLLNYQLTFKFQTGKIKKFANAEYQWKLNYRTGRCQ